MSNVDEHLGGWRSSHRDLYTRNIPIPREYTGFIIGRNGQNLRRLEQLHHGILSVLVEEREYSSSCEIVVKSSVEAALDIVEDDIKQSLASLSSRSVTVAGTKEIVFGELPEHEFWLRVLEEVPGVVHAAHGKLKCRSDIVHDIEYLINKIKVNGWFINKDILWKRVRDERPQLRRTSPCTRNVIHSAILMNKLQMNKVRELKKMHNVDFIDVECKTEDTVASVAIGAQSEDAIELVLRDLDRERVIYLKMPIFCRDESSTDSTACLPVPCGAECILQPARNYRNPSFLESTFDNFPLVTLLELNLEENILNVACKTADSLKEVVLHIRRQIFFWRKRPWISEYIPNISYIFKINLNPKSNARCQAFFVDEEDVQEKFVDTIDVICEKRSYICYKMLQRIDVHEKPGNFDRNIPEHDFENIKHIFTKFIQFDDFTKLDNIQVQSKFHDRILQTLNERRQQSCPQLDLEHTLLDLTKCFQNTSNCSDLKLSSQSFIEFLNDRGFRKFNTRRNVHLKLRSVSSNQGFQVDLEEGELLSIQSNGMSLNPMKIESLSDIHITLNIIGTDLDIQRLSQTICVSSQKLQLPSDCENLVCFIENAIKNDEILREGIMSMNLRYSMSAVSITEIHELKHGKTIIQIHDMSRKSNPRYGKFAKICQVSLACPELDEQLSLLKRDINNESVKALAINLFKEFVCLGEEISEELNIFMRSETLVRAP